MLISKIISGGQTGVDRAALDFALDNDIPCGGWCPKGRLAEDGIIHSKYPLRETNSPEYSERTRKNIEESDATLIIIKGEPDEGTLLTKKFCEIMNKPYLKIDISSTYRTKKVIDRLGKHDVRVLNVAGPRESSSPGIYADTYLFLSSVFSETITLS